MIFFFVRLTNPRFEKSVKIRDTVSRDVPDMEAISCSAGLVIFLDLISYALLSYHEKLAFLNGENPFIWRFVGHHLHVWNIKNLMRF